MKLSFALVTIVSMAVGAKANNAAITSAFDIQLSCANIHHDNMSPKALAFGAKALEVSFNSVHKKADGLTLTEVTATPNGDLSQKKNIVKAKKGLRRGSTCKYCANDDLVSDVETLFFAAKGMEEDIKTCKYCANDDDAAALLGEDKIQLWQNELNAIFIMSPYSSLNKAEDCSITIAPRAEPAVKTCKYCANDDMQVEQQAVTIDVQCDKLDFSSAPVRVLSVATKALAESYDAIHSTEENHLSDIYLAGPRLSFSSDSDNKSIKTCKYCANDDDAWIVQESSSVEICKYCANDDLTTSEYAIEFSAITTCKYCANDDATVLEVSEIAANRAWEQLFMAKMMKEGLDTGACKLVLAESAMA